MLIEKVIFELINNYKGSDDYVESQEEDIKYQQREGIKETAKVSLVVGVEQNKFAHNEHKPIR